MRVVSENADFNMGMSMPLLLRMNTVSEREDIATEISGLLS